MEGEDDQVTEQDIADSGAPDLPDVPDEGEGSGSLSIGGPGGINVGWGDIANGVSSVLTNNSGPNALPTDIALYDPTQSQGGSMDQLQQYIDAASSRLNKSLTRKLIVRFIVRFGWAMAAQAFGIPQSVLVALFAAEKARPTRRLGPHLSTVLKQIKKGKRFEKLLAGYARKAHVGGGHKRRASAPAKMRFVRGGKR